MCLGLMTTPMRNAWLFKVAVVPCGHWRAGSCPPGSCQPTCYRQCNCGAGKKGPRSPSTAASWPYPGISQQATASPSQWGQELWFTGAVFIHPSAISPSCNAH